MSLTWRSVAPGNADPIPACARRRLGWGERRRRRRERSLNEPGLATARRLNDEASPGADRRTHRDRYGALMGELGENIHSFIDDDRAVRWLSKYYGGKYTGSRFDTAAQLQSPDPHCFTAHDFAAVATLSVPMSGRAICGLLDREATLTDLLRNVPFETGLVDATDEAITAIYAVQSELDKVMDIGHVTRSKLLAHKRPQLIPIRDQYVLKALIGRDHGSFTEPLRDTLTADRSITERLDAVQRESSISQHISTIRALDVIVWMSTHGDAQVDD